MVKSSRDPVWLFDIPNPRALVVVAHPDDETIFAAGLILRSRETRWTVICCTTEGDPRRKDEFLCACDFLAQKSGNHIEPISLGLLLNQDGLIDHHALANELKRHSTGYDIVLTHNRQGEYGHEHHKLVHHCMINTIENPNTWVFISPGSRNVNAEELRSKIPNGNYILYVSPEIRKQKVIAFHECHVSQAKIYGYEPISGKLRDTDLKETLSWYFENPGTEEYTYYK